ncbi:MAG: electron transport complex subunit E [Oscillospiraceae bacterium]|nr:electron transport complex subunit E [Oscillospiraceae bacterium]
MNKLKILINGLIKENPVLVLVLGTCPTLATSTSVKNAVGMGLAATFVLVGSNIVISLLKKIIPDKVRIPCYIVVIATFVTIVSMLLQAFVEPIYNALGIFLPLIVVNCIILGRAEMFASKNSVFDSMLDGVGMGLGFTLALFLMSSLREIIGSGTWLGIQLYSGIQPMSILTLAPGGFFVFGCLVALVNYITNGKSRKKQKKGCAGCPSAAVCANAEKGECNA